jgi:hypothetical protein
MEMCLNYTNYRLVNINSDYWKDLFHGYSKREIAHADVETTNGRGDKFMVT